MIHILKKSFPLVKLILAACLAIVSIHLFNYFALILFFKCQSSARMRLALVLSSVVATAAAAVFNRSAARIESGVAAGMLKILNRSEYYLHRSFGPLDCMVLRSLLFPIRFLGALNSAASLNVEGTVLSYFEIRVIASSFCERSLSQFRDAK